MTTGTLTTTAEYFVRRLGRPPADPVHRRLPLNEDCASVIDAGRALIDHVRAAAGADRKVEEGIVAVVEAIINVYNAH